MKVSRKSFLRTALLGGAAWASGLAWSCGFRPAVRGGMYSPRFDLGHLLRDGKPLPTPTETIRTGILIAGAGISGLSAARALERSGRSDFLLLDLENEPGGNAAGGENEISGFPWGAHYLPVPDAENRPLLEFLHEAGVVTELPASGLPTYREEYLCHAPQERLLFKGVWQNSLIPQNGLSGESLRQVKAWSQLMEELKVLRGEDEKEVFAIPISASSRDAEWLALDEIPFSQWLDREGWKAPELRWYLNYCCRDDFSAGTDAVSAWAGLHYFASRKGLGTNAAAGSDLTWPEGNQFLVNKLFEPFRDRFQANSMLLSVQNEGEKVIAEVYRAETETVSRIEAEHAVLALPHFVANYVAPELKERPTLQGAYPPWVVANLVVDMKPGNSEVGTAWDNVRYGAESLGYISAQHQALRRHPGNRMNLTWYHVMPGNPKTARLKAHEMTWEDWKTKILTDLETMHQGISEKVLQLDVRVWGHAMISPKPGFIWSEELAKAREPLGNIHFAHTDLSGISIFEEGFAHGLRVAREITGEAFYLHADSAEPKL